LKTIELGIELQTCWI